MEADDVETEVQHLVVGTFHTNLYHSLRNDWPTTPVALTRSDGDHPCPFPGPFTNRRELTADICTASYQPYEGEEDQHIVEPYPLETNKVVLNNCQFAEFPAGNATPS